MSLALKILLLAALLFLSDGALSQTVRHKKDLPPPDKEVSPSVYPKIGLAPSLIDSGGEEGHPIQLSAGRELGGAPLAHHRAQLCKLKHSTEELARIPTIESPQAAGIGVYFIARTDQGKNLYYMARPGILPKPVAQFSDPVSFFRATKSGDFVATVVEDSSSAKASKLFVFDQKKNQAVLLWQKENVHIESVAWEPNDKSIFFTANGRSVADLDLYRIDISARHLSLVSELKGENAIMDVSPNGKRIALIHWRSYTDSDLIIWDVNAKKTLIQWARPGYLANARFTADSDHIFLLSDKESGFRHVHLFNLNTSRLEKALNLDLADTDYFEVDPARHRLILALNDQGSSTLVGYTMDSQGNKEKMFLFPKREAFVIPAISFSQDNQRSGYFVLRSSSSEPTGLWYMATGQKARWTLPAAEDPLAHCYVVPESIRYPSFDGTWISALLYEPAPLNSSRPTVFFIHDVAAKAFRPAFNALVQYWLERGFSVFAPNLRGSAGFGRTFSQADDGEKRYDAIRDLIEGAHWILQKKKRPSTKLFLRGQGYGAFIALRTLAAQTESFSGGSVSFPVLDWTSYLSELPPYRKEREQAEFGFLGRDTAFLESLNPRAVASEISSPLQIFLPALGTGWMQAAQLANLLALRKVAVELRDVAKPPLSPSAELEIEKQSVYFFQYLLKSSSKATR